ncbi:MAG: site-2 protease family protein, partial [Firmicutes bacterium]|nr:site-2 protease family protein [Bacillota bacterium]
MKTLIASIFVFGLLIFFHELGHFLAARACGIAVLELAIGFGPKIFGWRRDNTDYSLRLLPLGGFCRMLGESPDETGQPG